MTPYEWFLAWYPLALALPAAWMAVAYSRAALLAAPLARNARVAVALAALVLCYLALIIALSGSGGGILVIYLTFILAQFLTLVLRREPRGARRPFIPLDQHVAALAFARRAAIADPRPDRGLRRRAAALLAASGLLAGAIFALGWQLQPCAALDRGLQLSGCQRQLRVPQRWSSIAALAPDGRSLALASHVDSSLYVIDTDAGQLRASLAPAGKIRTLAWSPDARLLAVGTTSEWIEVWDVVSQQPLWRQKLAGDSRAPIAFSPDGALLAVAQGEQAPQILRAADGVPLDQLAAPPGRVDAIAFSPNGRWLAVVAWRGVSIYDLASNRLLPDTLEDGISIAWHDADTLLITGRDTYHIASAGPDGLRIERSYGLGWPLTTTLFQLTPTGRPLVTLASWSYHLQGEVITLQTLDDGATVGQLRFPGAHVDALAMLAGGELLTVQSRTMDAESLLRIWRFPGQP